MGIVIGVLNVRRSGLIKAPPARVWKEFVSFETLSQWFGIGHTLHSFEPRVGGSIRLSVEIDGERAGYGGRVLVYEAERELTFESQWDGARAWPAPTLITIRLTPVYEGTLVEIFHHGFERFGAIAADELEGYESGWDTKHIKKLRAIIER